jgi:hypothetical protein
MTRDLRPLNESGYAGIQKEITIGKVNRTINRIPLVNSLWIMPKTAGGVIEAVLATISTPIQLATLPILCKGCFRHGGTSDDGVASSMIV